MWFNLTITKTNKLNKSPLPIRWIFPANDTGYVYKKIFISQFVPIIAKVSTELGRGPPGHGVVPGPATRVVNCLIQVISFKTSYIDIVVFICILHMFRMRFTKPCGTDNVS